MIAMASKTRLYGDCKGHKSVKTCSTCLPIRTKLWGLKQSDQWREKRRIASLAYKRAKSAARELKCIICGAPREKRRWYCDPCREASNSYSKTRSRKQRRRAGWKSNRKLHYRNLVARVGKEELARRARELYHQNRFKGMKDGT